jgi:uncharacterized Ntn-hydrolase superfamily protein
VVTGANGEIMRALTRDERSGTWTRSRVAGAALLLFPLPAAGTWSIVATDAATREVGIAVASCIAGVERTAGVVPGKGVIASQGIVSPRALARGRDLIGAGASPSEVVAAIANEKFDPDSFLSWRSGSRVRQYGVVALGFEQAPAAFTGRRTFDWSGALTGPGVSVQGNMLRGPEVLLSALDVFDAAQEPGCSLADRLVAALVAGSRAGGDWRCSRELTALSAYVEVALPDDPANGSGLRLDVTDPRPSSAAAWRFLKQRLCAERGTAGENPVTVLAGQYAQWRRIARPDAHCPALIAALGHP